MSKTREVRIFCPKCNWKPRQQDRWSCTCGCIWNTFDTGGMCPDCGKAHQSTQCLSCARFSPHAEWYHDYRDGELVVEETEVQLEPATA